MWTSPVLLGLLLACLLCVSEGYVQYLPCKEYVYKFRAKTTLHGTSSILLKGKAGFQFLANRTTSEALLRLHNARMEQGVEEVNLLETYNFGNWFSIRVGTTGEILSVSYPKHETYDVIAVKKTVVGYLSGKLKALDEAERYETEEEGPEGKHVANYQRQTDAFDAVYVKKKKMGDHVAAEHADLRSSKTTYISHEMRVPHRIVMEENILAFSKSKPGYKMGRPKMGPRGNLTFDPSATGKENMIPGIRIDAKGEMELLETVEKPCDIQSPSGLRNDSLIIALDNEYQKLFWKSDYTKEMNEVHENLDSNLTCIRRSLSQSVPEKSDCFHNILSILKMIPEEFLPDIIYIYLERNEKHATAFKRQDRHIMMDAILSLRTELSQKLMLDYVTNPNRTTTMEDHQKCILQFGSFDQPPVQDVVDYIEDIAFSNAETEDEKHLKRMAVLAYGIMVNLYFHKGNEEQKKMAHQMTQKLEDRVGIHDPYHWRVKRSTGRHAGRYDSEMDQAGLVESLGNAGLPRSYEHILSHVNSSETPYSLRRAGLHALRKFDTHEAAGVLLEAALFDEEQHIRAHAQTIYQNHPMAADFHDIHREIIRGYANGTFPRCPKPLPDDEYAVMPHHHRIMRRSVWKGIQFHLKTPYVEWAKQYGNAKLGASMGLKIQNELDIDIKLTSGHVRVNIDDYAYAIAHVGLIGKNLEFLNAKLCLIGFADYELNLLQEFGFNDVKEFVKYWDRFQNGVVKNIKEAVEKFRQFMVGVKDFAKNIENLDETIEDIPRKVKNLRNVAIQAARKIGSIDKNAIPPFAKPLINTYWRVIKLHNDIKSDVMNFYNGLADVVRIEIPTSWRQIREGVYTIGKSIKKLFKSPKEAFSGIFKAVFKVKIGIDGLKDAKKKIEDMCAMVKDEKPYWWDLSKQLNEISDELRSALGTFQRGYVDWVKKGVDDFENEMRREAAKVILEVHTELTAPFRDLDKLAAPFLLGLSDFSKVLDEVKQAWGQLKTAYREGRSIIDRLFGPKAYISFPKKLRSAGAGCGDGVYPSTNGGRYSDAGVDLEAEAGKQVKSPFAGSLSVHSDGRLVIEPDGSTFEDVTVYVTNIQPAAKVPRSPGRVKIYSGDILGTVKSTGCVNHLHVSMKQKGETIDPTRYLGQRKMKMPKWTQVCDEYKLVWLGQTRSMGYILRSKDEVDTSPKRSASEPTDVNLPEPKAADAMRLRRRKRDVSDVIKKVTSNFNKFKNTMLKFFDIPSDLGFSKFFRDFSIRRIRMGTMVGLLNQLGMNKSRDDLTQIIHSFIDMTKTVKCVRPQQMTDEELRISLLQRGVSVNGSREEMMKAYYERTSQCPMWGLSLPKKSACVFDKSCLGVECCLDYRIGIFYKALKAYASIDPCTQILEMGIIFHPRKWKKSIQVRGIPYGQEEETFTGLKVDVFGKLYTIKIKYLFSNDKVSALLNLDVTLCRTETECLPYIDVVKDMLLPVPSCKPDGTIVWPDINLKDFFNRKHLIDQLKKIKTNVAESAKEKTLEYIENELKLPSGFLRKEESVYCTRPSRMTRAQLLKELGVPASSATTDILREEVQKTLTKCDHVTLPPMPSSLFCRISKDCFKLDCCMDLSLPFLNKSVALSALIHFDPCKFTLSYGFDHAKKTKLLIDYKWGLERSWNMGALKIKYIIDKTEDSKFFVMKFGLTVCLKSDKCLIDKWILNNHRIPVPVCNQNFTKCFGSGYSFKSLMESGIVAATKEAMTTVLRCLDVEKYLKQNHGCPTAKTCTTDLTPTLERTCYPGLPCWRIQCNFRLNLFVMKKDVCAWIAFNPCSYELELGLGAWKYKNNLMKLETAVMHEVRVGSGLRIYYRYAEGATRKTFKLQFGVAVCHKDECTPTKFVIDNMEIAKPFCDRNFTRNLPGGSIPNFLRWLGVNTTKTVARLAIDRALSYLGIRQCLTERTCVLPSGVSLDGWSRTCPQKVTGLPALSSNLRCSFSSSCRAISCCLDFDIKIWQGSLSFFYEFDPCNLRLKVGFENCTAEENSVVVGRPASFIFHENVTFWYLITRHPEGKGLYLSFRVHVCEEQCGWLNILENTLFEIDCKETAKARPRREAVLPAYGSSDLALNDEHENEVHLRSRRSLIEKIKEKAEDRIPKLLKKFDDLVSEGKEKATQSYGKIQKKMEDAFKQIYGKDPQERSLVISATGNDNVRSSAALIKPPSPAWNWEVIPPSGGAELFKIKRGESGDMKFVVGDGLTQAGIALLGDAIANMTIGDLESMLDFKNVDPASAYRIIKQLRELYFHLVTELIDVVFGGRLNDALFKSFDYVMRGKMSFPRLHYTYFEYNYYFFVFPVPCLFSLGYGASGYWGIDFYMRFNVLSMLATGTVDPYIGMMAYGKGSANCVIFRGTLQLNGYIMETHLPTTAEIGFYKFPLDIGLNVDIVIIPLRFELVAHVEMKLLFFMKRKKRWGRIRIRVRRIVRGVARAIGRVIRWVGRLLKKIFKWKTLFRKVLWEWSMKPWRIPGIIRKKRKRKDMTPPSFNSKSRRKRSVMTTDGGCRVFQIPNRPYEEPAIVLESDPTDDVSKVAMYYSIGTTKGGTNVVNGMRFQGPSSIIEGRLASRGPLYFTITASNSQGMTAKAFCNLPVYDVTPPAGHVISPYHLTSDPSSIKMEARIFEESPITQAMAGIGYGVGLTGDALKGWHPVTVRRIIGPADSRGLPYKVIINYNDLNMLHNQLYFVNVHVRNALNYTAIISSSPVLVDLSPPTSPHIISPTSDRVAKDDCRRYTLKKWSVFCPAPGSPRVPNHRLVVDSPTCSVLWNGHKADEAEVRWTMNSHFIAGRFTALRDNETAIRGYSMCVGSAIGRCDVFPAFDPHEAIMDPAEWNYVGFAVKEHNVAFPDGKYFLTLTTINRVTNGGPFATTVSRHRPFVIDTTPPEVEFAGRMRYNVEARYFRFLLRAKDVHSGLWKVSLGAGRTRHDLSIAPMRVIHHFPNSPDAIDTFDGELGNSLTIKDGQRVYVHLLVYNNVDLEEEYTSPRPFVVDTTPPLPGRVFTGRRPGENARFFGRPEELCVSWSGFSDPDSGIGSYSVTLGSCQGCDDLLEKEDLHPDTEFLCLPANLGHRLTHERNYYATVTAANGGSEGLRVSVNSSAMMYDSTPPVNGKVVDGLLPGLAQKRFSSDRSFYRFQWQSSTDPESGIAGYRVSVFRKPTSSSKTETLRSGVELRSSDLSYLASGLDLRHQDRLHAELVAINGAKLQRRTATAGLSLDFTPPVTSVLHDGDSEVESRRFQSVADRLNVTFISNDVESDISEWKFSVFKFVNGQRHLTGLERTLKRETSMNPAAAQRYSISPVTLTPGHRYGVELTAINGAGLHAVQDSPGVVVDVTAPHIESVAIGSLMNRDAETHEGYVWHQNQDTLTVTVLAFDPESQVKTLWVSVGTSPGASDVSALKAYKFISEQFISLRGLHLALSDLNSKPKPKPAYYVTVKAENFAGLKSSPKSSLPILVIPDDSAGEVFAGPTADPVTHQVDHGRVVATFRDFSSPMHGIERYEFAVGSEPGLDDVQRFTDEGIVNLDDERTRGQMNLPVDLEVGKKHFVTVRAFTNAGRILESVSAGLTVSQSKPTVSVELMSQRTPNRGVVYSPSAASLPIAILASPDSHLVAKELSAVPILGEAVNKVKFDNAEDAGPGVPVYTNVLVENGLGFQEKNTSVVIVSDLTAPTIAGVNCNKVVQRPERSVTCTIDGLQDTESPITETRISLMPGTAASSQPVVSHRHLGPVSTHTFFLTENDLHRLGATFRTRIEVTNAAGLSRTKLSSAMSRDLAPPSAGVVVDLGDVRTIRHGPERSFYSSRKITPSLDQRCQVSRNALSIAWQPFTSPQSPILRYEVAVGSYRGATDLKNWTIVGPSNMNVTIHGVNMWKSARAFAMVRAVTVSGASSVGYSSGISISRLAVGMQTSSMGVFDGVGKNSRFQSDPMMFQSRWNFTDEPCPITRYEWAVTRADGQIIRNFTDMKGMTEGVHFGLNAHDGDTFFSFVKLTNALDMTYMYRSHGITIKMQPLIPGLVNDGLIAGHDLKVQAAVDMLSANWRDFKIPHSTVSLSGNVDQDWKPKIEYYEVAFGTDPHHHLDDVVPFTNVGLNTSAAFHRLELNAQSTVYHATVRAYSRWFSKAQATSSGIRVGMDSSIEENPSSSPQFTNTTDFIVAKWEAFKSAIGVKMYFVGMQTTGKENVQPCSHVVLASDDSSFLRSYYDAYPRTLVDKATLQFNFTDLPIKHNTNYSIEVIGVNSGGKCARSTSFFFADFTPPVTGEIRLVDKATFKNVYFVRETTSLNIKWSGFVDEESSIDYFTISLLQSAPGCAAGERQQARLKNGKPAVFKINGGNTGFVLEDLNMQVGVAYFVNIAATNRAGSTSDKTSNAILVEQFTVSPGVVKTTDDFTLTTANYFSDDDVDMNVTFLHTYASGHLELETVPISTDAWTGVQTSGLINIRGYPWLLYHRREMIAFEAGRMDLKMQRLIGQRGVKAGAASRLTTFRAGGSFAFRLRAATGQFAVSSFVVWDGEENAAADFHPSQHREMEVFCGCCLEERRESCPCDCLKYTESMLEVGATTPPPTAQQQSVQWSIIPEGRETVVGTEQVKRVRQNNACGVQLTPSPSARHNVTLWCFNKVTGFSVFDTVPLAFDASAGEHDYKIDYIHSVIDTWSIRLLVDGLEVISIEGALPVFPDTVTALFHIWNRWESLAPLESVEKPYQVMMSVRNIKFPNPKTALLRYGHPFRISDSIPVQYDVRIALIDSNTTNIVSFINDWQTIAAPCVPCISACSSLYCDPADKCPRETLHTQRSTLRNVGFMNWVSETIGNITRFQVHLRLRSYGGFEVTSVSTPATLDFTPPVQLADAPLSYFDAASEEPYRAVLYQASNTTLRVLASFTDPESGIEEVNWAAGTEPGATDIFDYMLVTGPGGIAEKSGLSLMDNTSYYVTLAAVNNAGLVVQFVDYEGVRVLTKAPDVKTIEAKVPGTQKFGEGVRCKDTKVTRNADEIRASWHLPSQEYETKSEFCVGSRPGVVDDVVDCLKITHHKGGSANITFRDGELQVANITDVNITDVLNGKKENFPKTTGIHLEPGKTLHYHIRACNAADKCNEKPMDKVQVMGATSTVITPPADRPSSVFLNLRSRRKRDTISVGSFSVDLKTSGEDRVSLIAGPIDDKERYRADSVIGYNSYIVRVEETKSKLSRMLRHRMHKVLEPTFYISTVGQAEMEHAMEFSVDLEKTPIGHGMSPEVIYWNTETKLWSLAYFTCLGGSKSRLHGRIITVRVCRTQSGAANYTTPLDVKQLYFRYETQFAVALIRDTIMNLPPVITTVTPLYINGTEEQYIARIQMKAVDPENDPIFWTVDPPLPTHGRLVVNSTTGILRYEPYIGVIGTDVLRVRATDRPPNKEIPSKSAEADIYAHLCTSVNSPYLVVSVDKVPQTIRNDREEDHASFAVVGLTEGGRNCHKPTTIDIYALHIDPHKQMDILMPKSSRYSSMFRLGNVTIVDQAFNSTDSGIPNSLSMYTWYHASMTYGFIDDTTDRIQRVKLVAEDAHKRYSKPLVLEISIMEAPCEGHNVYERIVIGVSVTCAVLIIAFIIFAIHRYRRKRKIMQSPVVEFDAVDRKERAMESFDRWQALATGRDATPRASSIAWSDSMPMTSLRSDPGITSASNPHGPGVVLEKDITLEDVEC